MIFDDLREFCFKLEGARDFKELETIGEELSL